MQLTFPPSLTRLPSYHPLLRYAEKERANTSLLRYLNEQQAEIGSLTEIHKEMAAKREELQARHACICSH